MTTAVPPKTAYDGLMSDAAQPSDGGPHGTSLLPADLTPEQIAAAPVIEDVDTLLIEDLTDHEADAFFGALGL